MAMSPEMLALIKGAKNKYSRSGGKIQKPKEGKTRYRIIPTQVGGPLAVPGQFWLEYGVHWIKTEANGKPVAVVGNSMLVYGTPSPIDAAIERAIKGAVDDEDLKLMTEWKAKKGVLLNAIVRSGSDASEDPIALELTPTTYGNLMSMIETYAEDGTDATDLKTGFDFTIDRVGKGLETKYSVIPHPGAKPVSKDSVDKSVDLFALVEREFFRGEETKAIAAIANMTGIATTGLSLAGPAKSTTAALLTSRAVVADAEVEAVAAALVEAEAVEAPVESKAARMRRELAEAEAEEAAELAAVTAAAKAKVVAATKTTVAPKKPVKPAVVVAPPTTPVEADTFGAEIDAADMDKMLAELDSI